MATVASISYFKRYKMETDLRELPSPQLPEGFDFVGWRGDLLDVHAEVLFGCFQQEIDARVFPSLGDRQGSLCLMIEMSRKRGFLPEATWLLMGPVGPCGTVQGMRERSGLGSIQNLGILPGWRGRGLGEALLLQALHGFCQAGLGRGLLEVTAQNDTAIRLYRRLGFRRAKTLYKAVPDWRGF
ncbi:MAG TPA: N-acetyltransferase [Gemmataceae bacterium]|nr:N-acetyltransferase [Gemmataceae bacterium]